MVNIQNVFALLQLFLFSVCFGLKPVIVLEQVLFEGGSQGEVYAYRIPVATLTPKGTVVVYVEARKYSRADAKSKFLAGRSSVDGGYNWSEMAFLVSDFVTNDGINLGATLYNAEQSELLIMFTVCAHRLCENGVTSNYMLKSVDDGISWQPPVDISKANPALFNYSWTAGPGYGIQKKVEPHRGRLVVCGHTVNENYHGLDCIISDDQGVTWKRGASQPSLPKYGTIKSGGFFASEVQIVELKNGSILFNARNALKYQCACRIILRSDDGGDTIAFDSIYFDATLVDPTDAGAILMHGDYLFFSNAANASARKNITLRWSENEGKSWDGTLSIYPGEAAYSTLTSVDENHVAVVYERSMNGKSDAGSIWFTLVKIN
ncbi:sialidase-1-like [Antedon mediterranea]|uniref:sialidase-1-like n=1 Tax=Antedon mediterranea TaxID=105859 RepID=UPI003AF87A1D